MKKVLSNGERETSFATAIAEQITSTRSKSSRDATMGLHAVGRWAAGEMSRQKVREQALEQERVRGESASEIEIGTVIVWIGVIVTLVTIESGQEDTRCKIS
jgi:hypothetical protein